MQTTTTNDNTGALIEKYNGYQLIRRPDGTWIVAHTEHTADGPAIVASGNKSEPLVVEITPRRLESNDAAALMAERIMRAVDAANVFNEIVIHYPAQ